MGHHLVGVASLSSHSGQLVSDMSVSSWFEPGFKTEEFAPSLGHRFRTTSRLHTHDLTRPSLLTSHQAACDVWGGIICSRVGFVNMFLVHVFYKYILM